MRASAASRSPRKDTEESRDSASVQSRAELALFAQHTSHGHKDKDMDKDMGRTPPQEPHGTGAERLSGVRSFPLGTPRCTHAPPSPMPPPYYPCLSCPSCRLDGEELGRVALWSAAAQGDEHKGLVSERGGGARGGGSTGA